MFDNFDNSFYSKLSTFFNIKGCLLVYSFLTLIDVIFQVFNPYIAGGSVVTGDEFAKGSNLNLARLLLKKQLSLVFGQLRGIGSFRY